MRKQKTVRKEQIFCDVCEKENTDFFQFTCSMCRKDLCRDCHIDHPYEGGDGPQRFCPSCFEICKPFIERIRVREEEQSKEIEAIEDEMAQAVITSRDNLTAQE